MASYKSQNNLPRRAEGPTLYSSRPHTTRLPQKSVTPASVATSQLPSLSHSKLQKRIPSRDETTQSSRRLSTQRLPLPASSTTVKARQGSALSVSASKTLPMPPTRSTPQPSNSRLPKLDTAITRTPLHTHAASTSSDIARSNRLRRKATSIGTTPPRTSEGSREGSMSSRDEERPARAMPGSFRDPFSETVLGISLPPSSSVLAHTETKVDFLPRHRYHDSDVDPTEVLSLPTPQYALSTTPSTRYSESPGPFSVSSTPTSMSSYSPGTVLSNRSASRIRQVSPLHGKPPVSRHDASEEPVIQQRHAALADRESPNSSSSASTVVQEPSRPKQPVPPLPSSVPTKTRIQAPPELAHLADPPMNMTAASRRPVRPSRSGMAEVTGLREPSPIIQSNMTSFPSAHHRTTSTESKIGISTTSRHRFGLPVKPSSRNPSPSPVILSPPTQASRAPTREPTPDAYSQSRPGPAPSPSKQHRFGFFRRTKTESTPPPEKKAARRGPAAGTGHEGYGRYAVRGRSGSSVSGSSIGKSPSASTTTESLTRPSYSRKSSVTSTTSTDVDNYFLERLTPVTIRGGSSVDHSAKQADAGNAQNPAGTRPSTDFPKASNHIPQPSSEIKRPTLLPSAMSDPVRGITPIKRIPLGSRRPSESDDEGKRSFLPSFTSRATRASKVVNGAPLSKVTSADASTKQEPKIKPKKEKPIEKPANKPPRKWNFFQRAHAAPKADTPTHESPTAVSRGPQPRSVAHYALLDSKSGLDLDDIEQIMKEADSAPEETSQGEDYVDNAQPLEKTQRLQSILLPPKPIFPSEMSPPARPASPKVHLRSDTQTELPQRILTLNTTFASYPAPPASAGELTPVTDLSSSPSSRPISPVEAEEPAELVLPPVFTLPESNPPTLPLPGPPVSQLPAKPSRLPQVGRIPQVISRRPMERKLPPQSFSRPFIACQPKPSVPLAPSTNTVASSAIPSRPVEPFPVLHGVDVLAHGSAIATMSPSAEGSNRRSEFFKFPARKDSEVSYSSSSGAWSFPSISGTAVMPAVGAPQSEDEVWGEYDDLIDEVLSPTSAGAVADKPVASGDFLLPENGGVKASRVSTLSQASTGAASNPSFHLRRSRLLAVLHSAQSPASTSFSDFLDERGEQSLSVIDPVTGRLSIQARMSINSSSKVRPAPGRSSLQASLSESSRQSRITLASTSDKRRSSGVKNKYRGSRLMELAETRSNGLVSMADLRFGALMTSKWLSFGRVLFSPAHLQLKNPNTDRVLVIDGLGKDWSYYCALTYPEATIYNLGPGVSSSAALDGAASEPWSTLRNHHYVGIESLAAPFPFPMSYFACAVIRFPNALPSAVHRSVISECKRVLRPGGHLEFSVLDLDLVNMGNRARRAIRGLKVRMQEADEKVSLCNVSDEIMASIGRKGFEECNRCFVGVPVAGRLPGLDDVDSPVKKRKGSSASTLSRNKSSTSKTSKDAKADLSFSDLLNKHTSSASTDQGITDMVARVGRWWYSRCYESLVLPEAGEADAVSSSCNLENSIWLDEKLIKECETRGTTFRLLIGYAQKPEVGVRRTVSV